MDNSDLSRLQVVHSRLLLRFLGDIKVAPIAGHCVPTIETTLDLAATAGAVLAWGSHVRMLTARKRTGVQICDPWRFCVR